MAQAIISGIGIRADEQIFIASPSLTPGVQGQITRYKDNLAVIEKADTIFLCVKPTQIATVLQEAGRKIPMGTMLVSVAAGINLDYLQQFCNPFQAIVRCMPNLPLSVGRGAIPMVANSFLQETQKLQIEALFQRMGIISWLEDESLMNAFTALSGSGPAYVFLLAEAMTNAAVKLGLEESVAQTFTRQTISGAVAMMEQSDLPAGDLRKKVTSPAGTTAAAIAILQQHGFETIVNNAMQAACERAKALGG